jgi:hypothetical protein
MESTTDCGGDDDRGRRKPGKQEGPGPRSRAAWLIAAYVLASLATAFGVFRLPYLFPPQRETYVSGSFVFGFSNRVAILAVVAGVCLFYLLAGALRPETREALAPSVAESPEQTGRVSRWLFALVALWHALFIALFYVVNADGSAYGEYHYFLHRIHLVLLGRAPYADFEYFYGPALLYPPVWLHRLIAPSSVRVEAAYYLYLGAASLAGLGLLAFVLGSLKLKTGLRNLLFAGLGFLAVPENLGLQYTLVRFVAPFASVLLVHRLLEAQRMSGHSRPWLIFIASAGAVVVNLSISPEMGIVTGACVVIYLLLAARWVGLVGIAGVAAGVALVMLTFSPSFLYSTLSFSSGYNNNPVVPAPYIVLYIAALLFVVPLMLRSFWTRRSSTGAANCALAALCVALMPAALGLCDALHILTNGMIALALAGSALSQLRGRWAQVYSVCLFAVFGVVLLSNDVAWHGRTIVTDAVDAAMRTGLVSADRLTSAVSAVGKNPSKLLARRDRLRAAQDFGALQRYPAVYTPLGADEPLVRYLISTGQWRPDYFDSVINICTPSQLPRKLEAVSASPVIVVPSSDLEGSLQPSDPAEFRHWLSRMYLFPYRATPLRALDTTGHSVKAFIRERFKPVGAFDVHVGGSVVNYTIMTQASAAGDLTRPVSGSG